MQSQAKRDDPCSVTVTNNASSPRADTETVREIFAEIDGTAALADGQWANKRGAQRRPLRAMCTVRHVAPNGSDVVTTAGATRDISQTGISFISHTHFARGGSVHIKLAMSTGVSRGVTGTVVFSRVVRDGWYLTGIRFEPCDDARLTGSDEEEESTEAQSGKHSTKGHEPSVENEQQVVVGARDRALRLLSSAASTGVHSKEGVDRIILLSASRDHTIRRASVPALLQIGPPSGSIGLAELLKDPNPEIQVEAAEALGHMGSESAIEPLRDLLTHDDPEIALRVAAVLGRLGDRSGLGIVRRCMAKRSPHARSAVRTLGIITGQRFRLNDAGIAEARRQLKKL